MMVAMECRTARSLLANGLTISYVFWNDLLFCMGSLMLSQTLSDTLVTMKMRKSELVALFDIWYLHRLTDHFKLLIFLGFWGRNGYPLSVIASQILPFCEPTQQALRSTKMELGQGARGWRKAVYPNNCGFHGFWLEKDVQTNFKRWNIFVTWISTDSTRFYKGFKTPQFLGKLVEVTPNWWFY